MTALLNLFLLANLQVDLREVPMFSIPEGYQN